MALFRDKTEDGLKSAGNVMHAIASTIHYFLDVNVLWGRSSRPRKAHNMKVEGIHDPGMATAEEAAAHVVSVRQQQGARALVGWAGQATVKSS